MNVQRWIARRETSWRQLEQLLKLSEKRGLKSLESDQVRQMASLYRSVSADLARAQSYQISPAVIRDLRSLTSRGYSQIYQGSRRQEWKEIVDFYRYGFPEVVQQCWAYIAVATLLFMAGGAVGWWYAWQDDSFMTLVLSSGFVEEVRDSRELWTVSIMGNEPVVSSGLMINNITVAFFAIIGGVAMYLQQIPIITPPGGFTIYILVSNGVMIGCVAALVAQVNLAYDLWAFVFPHGALELPAIFLAGGAGLLLARGILLPGRYRRIDALKVYGLQAAKLVYGIVPMLVIAGIIEGFFSPQTWILNELKYVVGTAIFVALVQYCRRRRPEADTLETTV
ncbi:stage II sporulation protein M [cf. Phormidesmis sp. LEGE 11477]|uniref:stage II sporulation protein M n=1 Tax=cf. Phormidesmis sp. LEGE 11477 TaxID=1828680 RepID=UPI00187FB72A|nr:stage II sporulation protein M [cf. Phormidesmis sp. LEGE 11477]MBE9059608.1 stage II sporulation protein M [cf. Phormidesmis sp. LEGE 11477]